MASLRLFLILLVTSPYYIFSSNSTSESPPDIDIGRAIAANQTDLYEKGNEREIATIKSSSLAPYASEWNVHSHSYQALDMLFLIDTDLDGIEDDVDLDDDNDGILDKDECGRVESNTFQVADGLSETFNFPAASDGFTIDIFGLDNSFNMEINGTLLVPDQLQMAANHLLNGESLVRFEADNATYGQNGVPNIWGIAGDQQNPVIRIILAQNGNVTFQGKRNINAPLENLIIDPAHPAFNIINWNQVGQNTVIVSQKLIGPTHLSGIGYGLNCSNDTDLDGIPNYHDTDSDGDGCPDAIEGGGPFTSADIGPENTLLGAVGPDGVPVLAGLGQAVGSSQDMTIQDPDCPDPCDALASGNPDHDGDGISDICDLDDDNDGILDIDEGWIPDSQYPNCAPEAIIFLGDPAQVIYLDLLTGTSVVRGQLGFEVNAAAFNEFDGNHWVVDRTSPGQELKVIDPNTLATVLTIPLGIPALSAAINTLNKTYVAHTTSTIDPIRVFDCDPTSPTYGQEVATYNPPPGNILDIVFIENLGKFYGILGGSNTLYELDPATGAWTNLGNVDGLPAGSYGASFSSAEGRLFFRENNTGIVYEIDGTSPTFPVNPTATQLTNGPTGDGGYDGARCSYRDLDGELIQLDTDKDGIYDYLDLDSDNDGCPDAIEGGGTYSYENLDPKGALMAAIDPNGVPNMGASQSIGSSRDAEVVVCCNATISGYPDQDADGLADMCDLDDDNDGILDADECPVNDLFWATAYNTTSDPNVITGSINGIEVTYSSSTPIVLAGGIFNYAVFPAQYGMPNTNPSIQNSLANTNTITFAQPVKDPVIAISSIGQGGLAVPVIFSEDIEVLWSNAVVVDGPRQITGNEGFAILRFNGYHASITFSFSTEENYCNIAFGANFLTCDTDGDRIPNHLDLDSDNDGCPDAIEGDGGTHEYVLSDLASNAIDLNLYPLDANGVPNNGANQGIGSSQDAAAIVCCEATSSSYPDSDGDGITDNCDTDDDNDGIPDETECGADGKWTLVDQADNTVLTNVATLTTQGETANISVSSTSGQSIVKVDLDFERIEFEEDVNERYIIDVDRPISNLTFYVDNIGRIGDQACKVGNFTITLEDGTVLNEVPFTIVPGNAEFIPINSTNELVEIVQVNGVEYVQDATSNSGNQQAYAALVFPRLQSISLYSSGIRSISFEVIGGADINAGFGIRGTVMIDTDGDNILDCYDLDSDNDGCADAIEGDGGTRDYILADLTNNAIDITTYPIDANGVPNNGASQGIGASKDATIVVCCDATASGYPDHDGDNVADDCDLDDDNDGITDETECGCVTEAFENGGFEVPGVAVGAFQFFDAGLVPGWETTATDNIIEIWHSGHGGVPSQEGNQFVELNAYQASTLYQTFCLNGNGGTVNWSVYHRGRAGLETANVLIGETLATATLIEAMTDGTTAWGFYSGTYTIPEGQTTLVIAFESANGVAVGNFLDDIQIDLNIPCPDFDGDGIPNSKDLDSDNDGCVDAIEGAGGTQEYVLADLSANTININTYPIDVNGVPNNGASQGLGASQDVNVIVCCDVSLSGYPDNDGDNIADECDLDDDNDGILDLNECSIELSSLDQIIENSAVGSNNLPANWLCNGSVDIHNGTPYWNPGPNLAPFEGLNYIGFHSGWNGNQGNEPYEKLSIPLDNPINIGERISFNFAAYVQDAVRDNDGPARLHVYGGANGCEETEFLGVSDVIGNTTEWQEFSITLAPAALNVEFITIFPLGTTSKETYLLLDAIRFQQDAFCDTDDDGIENRFDLDSDNDGCFDVVESGGTDDNTDGTLDGNGIDTNGQVSNGTGGYDGLSGTEYTATSMTIDVVPQDLTLAACNTAVFSVATSAQETDQFITGTPIYNAPGNADQGTIYQWYLGDPTQGGSLLANSPNISGVDTEELSILDISNYDGQQFCVVITHASNNCIEQSFCANLTIEDPIIITNNATICEGDAYQEGSSTYTTAGTYSETYTSIRTGCDSVVTTILIVDPILTTTNPVTICDGETYTEGTSVYSNAGTYTDTYQSLLTSCDSIVTTILMINPIQTTTNDVAICDGDSYTEGTSVYNVSGIYTDTYQSLLTGCDSVVTTILTVNLFLSTTNEVAICMGETYTEGISVYDQPGTYTDTYQSLVTGCDSIVTTILTVNPILNTTNDVTICWGEAHSEGNSVYTTAGTYTDTYQSLITGCDSIVTTNLIVNPILRTTNDIAICEGETYTEGNSIYKIAGNYTDTYQSLITGCDSIVTTNLTVNSIYNITNDVSICDGDQYIEGTSVYTATGLYTDNYLTVAGCDSIIVTNLTVLPTYIDTLTVAICDGDQYIEGTSVYTSTGVFTDSYLTLAGCDSIIVTDLTVLPTYLDTIEVSICNGDQYPEGNSVYTATGIYTDSYSTTTGCDSIIVTNLMVLPTYRDTIAVAICNGNQHTEGNSVYTTAGIYTDSYMTIAGCDSIIVTDLTILPTYLDTVSVSICDGDQYQEGNSIYTASGVYTDTYATIAGCDSVIVTDLSILPTYLDTLEVSICDGTQYQEGSSIYTTTGIYTDSYSTSEGCDSIIVTNLTVLSTYLDTIAVAICDGDQHTEGNSIYTAAGTYTNSYLTLAGCDSIIVTALSILPTYLDTAKVSICDGDEYVEGNSIYTTAGVYTDTYATIAGCDSVIVTELAVLPTYLDTISVSICDGEAYFEGNSVYTTTGIYTDTYPSISGCDSLIVTDLTVLPTYDITNEVEICDGDSHTEGTSVYSAPGTYTDMYKTLSGCDSMVTTILKVNPLPSIQVGPDETICEGDSVMLSAQGAFNYQWSTGEEGANIFVAPSIFETYSVFGISEKGCIGEMEWVDVNVLPKPIARFQTDAKTVMAPSQIKLENISQHATQYVWDFGDSNGSDLASPSHTYTKQGNYQIILTAINGIGCEDTATMMLEVLKSKVYIPSAFSPNNDGINDEFFVSAIDGVENVRTLIFSRWGDVLIEFQEINFSWDGTVNGRPVPEGVYVCRTIMTDIEGERFIFTNTLTLIR